jgi:DNA-binding response OmpR family regulator
MLEVLDKVSDKCIAEIEDLFYINSSLTWNKKNKCLLYNSELLNLAKYDLLLLEILLENFGLLCSIDKILNHFYLHNEDIKQDNIRNMVVRLRKKIPDINIQSIYGVGYKLVATI